MSLILLYNNDGIALFTSQMIGVYQKMIDAYYFIILQ